MKLKSTIFDQSLNQWWLLRKMGQALRRSTGKIRNLEPPPSSSSQVKNIERRPQPVPIEPKEISMSEQTGADDGSDSKDVSRINSDNVFEEEKDLGYDAMLSQMVGRIKSKSGGKLEMGEAFVVEKYNRPMPKLRNTKPESDPYEEKAVPPGTLNVSQLRQILQLHQGKSQDHNGPMDAHQIAEKFRLDAVQLQRILQFLSLPPEESNNKQKGVK